MTLGRDARRILLVQAFRAFAYGLGSVLIGVTLADLGFSGVQVGLVIAALVAGTALVSIVLARHGDRVGRRLFGTYNTVATLASIHASAELEHLPERLLHVGNLDVERDEVVAWVGRADAAVDARVSASGTHAFGPNLRVLGTVGLDVPTERIP